MEQGGRGDPAAGTRGWRPPVWMRGLSLLLGTMSRTGRSRAAALALIVLVTSLLPIATTVVTGLLVGRVPAAVAGGLGSVPARTALTLLAGASAMIVVGRVIGPFKEALAENLGRALDLEIQERVIAAVQAPSGIAHLEDPEVTDLVEQARRLGSSGMRPGLAVAALASLVPSWVQALGSALILVVFHWWVALLWLAVWPAAIWLFQREYIRIGQVVYGQSRRMRRAEYLCDLALAPDAAKDLRVWGMGGWLADRFEATWDESTRPGRLARRPGRGVVWLPSAAILAVNAVSYGLLAVAAARGDIGLAAVAVFTQALIAANFFRAFDDQNAQLSFAAVQVPALLQLEQRLRPAAEDEPTAEALPDAVGAISFKGVGFRYRGMERDVLRGLDLTLEAGRSLAVVGVNGAGKTTLVKLLCGLYRPTSGRITVGGRDLAGIPSDAWRKRVAALFQDFAQYHLSAADNIAMGAPDLPVDTDRLCRVAERAGVLDVIEGLPWAWETVLNRGYARGADLSGGQWQRVALARALYAVEAGARVLVLDEPTANLDVRAEAELYDRFLELTAGLTTVLISHRFSTVRRADRIVVLADGVVSEVGSHEELMSRGGRYAEMFRLQAARFTEEVGR
ncbi:MAG TPA: ABC transporter ATP-binding protein [Candidatus Dormibacteraeota bacterium]|nr:ABC transporter ATP-binding protein [Candidatus Dormibacteraeota bacterium]